MPTIEFFLVAWMAVAGLSVADFGYHRLKGIAENLRWYKNLLLMAVLGPVGVVLFGFFLYLDILRLVIGDENDN